MSAPGGEDELREAVARWLFHKVTRRDGLTKLQWEHLHYEEQQAGWLGWADELLPIVLADRERHARLRAAEELRAAAEGVRENYRGDQVRDIYGDLRNRADALSPGTSS